jgi:mRNA interferase RelE/StbE
MGNSSHYKLKTTPDISLFLKNLHPDIKRKIKNAIEYLLSDPDAGKNLKEELAGLKSFRTGSFRIIYRITKPATIELIAVGPRKNIYEITLKLLLKSSLNE